MAYNFAAAFAPAFIPAFEGPIIGFPPASEPGKPMTADEVEYHKRRIQWIRCFLTQLGPLNSDQELEAIKWAHARLPKGLTELHCIFSVTAINTYVQIYISGSKAA